MSVFPAPTSSAEAVVGYLTACLIAPGSEVFRRAKADREAMGGYASGKGDLLLDLRRQATLLFFGRCAIAHSGVSPTYCREMAAYIAASNAACHAEADRFTKRSRASKRRASQLAAREVHLFEPMIRIFIKSCAAEAGTPISRAAIMDGFIYRSKHRLCEIELERCRLLALDRIAMWQDWATAQTPPVLP